MEVERPDVPAHREREPAARLIAFYLPQFHPIAENDLWWGAGFTEWTNVAKAKPLFRGHRQPRLPGDLGFYDLRVPEVREHQAKLARDSGVEGFCYWHYWFSGRRILERPFEEVLASGRPDFPFCLAWANQSWTGVWHGSPDTKLISQEYPGVDDQKQHFDWALKAFRDDRYLKVDGRPIFVVYDPGNLPKDSSFVDHWRELAAEAGLPGLYFVAITNRHTFPDDMYRNAVLDKYDAVTPLVPQDYLDTEGRKLRSTLKGMLKERSLGHKVRQIIGDRFQLPPRFDYADVVDRALEDLPEGERFLPSVLPNWDNTPRSGHRGIVYEGDSPELFGRYLRKAVGKVSARPKEGRIIFLKAWNEWAEGNYVEPDREHGHAYLDMIRKVMFEG